MSQQEAKDYLGPTDREAAQTRIQGHLKKRVETSQVIDGIEDERRHKVRL